MLKKFYSDLENTNWGFMVFVAAVCLPSVAAGFHCLLNIWRGKALETFGLGIMAHPILTNLGVTYLEVFIGSMVTLIALLVGLYLRYRYYRDERDFMKKYNIKGKAGFSRDFKPSGHGNHYDTGHDE